ncbi:hypothetical protein ACWJJH_22315 [Endozoicomonadaceae bacterium StTr2]
MRLRGTFLVVLLAIIAGKSGNLAAYRNLALQLDADIVFWIKVSPSKQNTLVLTRTLQHPDSVLSPPFPVIYVGPCTKDSKNEFLLQVDSDRQCVHLRNTRSSWKLKETVTYIKNLLDPRTSASVEEILTYPPLALFVSDNVRNHLYALLIKWPVFSDYLDPRSWIFFNWIAGDCWPTSFTLELPLFSSCKWYTSGHHYAKPFNKGLGVLGIQVHTSGEFARLQAEEIEEIRRQKIREEGDEWGQEENKDKIKNKIYVKNQAERMEVIEMVLAGSALAKRFYPIDCSSTERTASVKIDSTTPCSPFISKYNDSKRN